MSMPTDILGRRIRDAEQFIELGKEEVREGMARGDEYGTRQGFEKLFHALSNAYLARVFAYRQLHRYARTHDELRQDLEMAGLRREAVFFEEIKEIFHGGAYYQGETNLFELARRYIETIEREVRTRLERIAEVR